MRSRMAVETKAETWYNSLMYLNQTHIPQLLRWMTLLLAVLCLGFMSFALREYNQQPLQVEGRLVPAYLRGEVPWKSIFADAIGSGVTLPANTNVIIHLPENMEKIPRKSLFGHRGETVRYWGYCFPEQYSVALRMPNRGFPGRVFLSEKERAVRLEKEKQLRRDNFTIPRDLTEERLNETETTRGLIRHQMEIFEPGMTCYVMSESPLPIGTDNDKDELNIYLERELGTDPESRDTDADGVFDGIEVFYLKSNPTRRDTDGDGLIDGLEDFNRNGKIDAGETNPLERDSDRDGLCDGLCRIGVNGSELRGEDVNLNGVVDDGELDPRKTDSDGDNISDEQEYFNCILDNDRTCKYSAYPVQ